MKIETHVCNIEQSKKLLQLGIAKNKSYLTWLEAAEYDEMGSKIIEWHPCLFYEHKGDYECCYCPVSMEVVSNDDEFIETKGNYPAFTLSELGQMLGYENVPYFSIEYDMWMLPKGSKLKGQGLGSINECIIRAELLIYAIENNLLSVKTCNSRLVE